ncbi:MAG: tetratricopeptide repeat protein, partial [Planctomycetaceae bacterium]|nr:tetratricopeptide repeat protein [Planctomycetaceae bacterium]
MLHDPRLGPIDAELVPTKALRVPSPVVETADDADVAEVLSGVLPSPVNYRVLIVSLIAVVVLVSGVFGLHAYQLNRIASEFRTQGMQAREAGNAEAAVGHLQRYLTLTPNDLPAIEELAFSIAEGADSPEEHYQAAQLLERILRSTPNADPVRRRLVDLYMKLGESQLRFHSDAVAHLDELILKEPTNPEYLALRAENLEHLGRYQDSAAAYATAIENAPRDLTLYQRLVRLQSGPLEQPLEALARLNELVQRNPQNAAAYLARSQFHWEQGSVRESRIDALRAYRLAPNDADVLVFLVSLIAFDHWPQQPLSLDELREKLTRIETAGDDDDGAAALAQVDLAVLAEDYDDAEARLKALLKQRPDWDTALQVYADVLILNGKPNEADGVIAQLAGRAGSGSKIAQFLRAQNAFSRHAWPAAAELYRRIAESRETGPIVRTIAGLQLAACYREMGQPDREQQACLDVLALNTNSAEAVFRLADAYLRNGNLDAALERFQMLSNSPEAAAASAMIVMEQERRRPASARRGDQVEAALESAVQQQPNPTEATLLRARFLIDDGQPAAAVEILERALKVSPGEARLWLQLFDVECSRQDWNAAGEVLKRADAEIGRTDITLPGRILLAAEALDREKLHALTAAVNALPPDEADADKRADLRRRLAIAWQTMGDFAMARNAWLDVKLQRPYDLSVLQSLVILDLIEANDENAQSLIAQMREIEGSSGVRWRFAEVERLLALVERGDRRHLDAADRILAELDAQLPPTAALSTRRGDVARLKGDVESALAHYRSAMQLGNPSRDCVFQLARLLMQRGESAEVGRLIRQFEEMAPRGLDARMAQIGALASLQDQAVDEALRFARMGTASDSPNAPNLIALGQFQHLAGQSEQAELSFRRATELAPDDPNVWIALVIFLTASNRTDDARSVVEQARSAVPADVVDFTLAQCFDVLGDVDRAAAAYDLVAAMPVDDLRQFESAIRFYVRTGHREKAAQVLRNIVNDGPAGAAPSLILARRLLAALLAESGVHRDRLEAIELFDRN